MKFIYLSLLTFSFTLKAQEVTSTILHKEFVPTAFGIRSRTIDVKEAEKVLKVINQFKLSNPKARISQIEILTCTSDYRLPQSSVTNRRVDEHIQLAKERHMMIIEKVGMTTQLPIEGSMKVCGPTFAKEDLNDRFVTKESGVIYEGKFKALIGNKEFAELLKNEALIENPEELKNLYPSPFLAKYKPFQGVRIFIKGSEGESESTKKEPTQPSGRSQ